MIGDRVTPSTLYWSSTIRSDLNHAELITIITLQLADTAGELELPSPSDTVEENKKLTVDFEVIFPTPSSSRIEEHY